MELLLNKSYTGEEIFNWCLENQLFSNLARVIFVNYYINEIKPNPKCYYFINKEKQSLIRDKEKSPRGCNIRTKELDYYINNNKSILGSKLLDLVFQEMKKSPSGNFIKFYDEIITSCKYRPEDLYIILLSTIPLGDFG